ncbi:MAG: hypothetical protein ABI761_05820 [Saprospiraceae bacterium]
MACPYPGPPCTTERSTSSSGNQQLIRGLISGSSISTDIGWKRIYFNNPIVSAGKISARILDENKKTVLVNFKQVSKVDNPLKNGYFYYQPVGLENLAGKKFVIYELKEKNRTYQFNIEIL